ncbi:MAG: hypothetical protein ACKVVP_02310 [Chloroflexota bacterium]
MALRERLVGLALILAGTASMSVLYWFWQHRGDIMLAPPPPPGLPRNMMPVASPLDCLMPFAALAAAGLVAEGFRRLIFPDNFGPED